MLIFFSVFPLQDIESAKASAKRMVLCVQEDGMHILFANLLKAADSSLTHFRSTAAMLIGTFEDFFSFH